MDNHAKQWYTYTCCLFTTRVDERRFFTSSSDITKNTHKTTQNYKARTHKKQSKKNFKIPQQTNRNGAKQGTQNENKVPSLYN